MINTIVKNGFLPNSAALAGGAAVTASDAVPVASTKSAVKDETKQPSPRPSAAEINAAVSQLNDYVQNIQRTLNFSVDEKSGLTVVKVIDTETNEVVRQIPAEESVKLAQALKTDQQKASLLVQDRV